VLPDKLPPGRAAAQRAVDLDPGLSEAHAALALARNLDWDWEGSEAAFRKAIELDPNSSMAHQWYAQLLRDMMRLDDALSEAQRARELDPLSLPVNTMVGWVLFNQHRFDEAIALWNYVLELDPNYGLAVYNKGLAYGMKGMGTEVISAARDAAQRWGGEGGRLPTTWLLGVGYALSGQRERATEIIRELKGQDSTHDWIAALHLLLGEEDTALDWLEKAYELHVPGLPNIMSEPWFDRLRDHPRFRALRAKTRLP
jgi:tetratricopeptide (TPR) repeat protein